MSVAPPFLNAQNKIFVPKFSHGASIQYFSCFRSSSKTRKSDVGSDAEFAIKIQANLARLRNDENFCDLELFSGECVEKQAAVRAHRYQQLVGIIFHTCSFKVLNYVGDKQTRLDTLYSIKTS